MDSGSEEPIPRFGNMYNRYFGFLESPFSVTPDPRFFFANPVYLEAYANLRYGIEAKKGFIAMTGEVGTGKTTLLRKLMRELESTIHSVFIFNTDVDFNELLELILRDLSLPAAGKNRLAMIDALNAYLIEQLDRRHTVCVLIDEVHNLSDRTLEGLRLLSNLETDSAKLLQVVLIGQPELNLKLERPNLRQLKQRIAVRCEITPLKKEEVGPYIAFRVQTAGLSSHGLFDADAIWRIAFYSKGIPRLINIMCDNALLIAYAGSKRGVSATMVEEVARDLRLAVETSRADDRPDAAAPSLPLGVGGTTRKTRSAWVRHKLKHPLKTGLGTAATIALIVFLAITDPQIFLARSLATLQSFRHNLNGWIVLATERGTIRRNAFPPLNPRAFKLAAVESGAKEHRATIQKGSTILNIATDAYGAANAVLGLDLIQEFNPQIKDLNWISAGQEMLLPALTPDTLVRREADGAYRIILASFLSRVAADEFARRLPANDHAAVIVPRRVANHLVIYRVEMRNLKDPRQANEILEKSLIADW